MTTDKEYTRLLKQAILGEIITREAYEGKGIIKKERLHVCGRWVNVFAWSVHERECRRHA